MLSKVDAAAVRHEKCIVSCIRRISCAAMVHAREMQISFEKVHATKAPQKEIVDHAKLGTAKVQIRGCWSWTAGRQRLSWLLACGKVPMCWCLPALVSSVFCCGPEQERGGRPRLEELSAELDRGDSGCPGALQANRGPLDPATVCNDLVH